MAAPTDPMPPSLRLAHWSARLAAFNDPQTRLAHLVEAARQSQGAYRVADEGHDV
jgi:hypothetical protein